MGSPQAFCVSQFLLLLLSCEQLWAVIDFSSFFSKKMWNSHPQQHWPPCSSAASPRRALLHHTSLPTLPEFDVKFVWTPFGKTLSAKVCFSTSVKKNICLFFFFLIFDQLHDRILPTRTHSVVALRPNIAYISHQPREAHQPSLRLPFAAGSAGWSRNCAAATVVPTLRKSGECLTIFFPTQRPIMRLISGTCLNASCAVL